MDEGPDIRQGSPESFGWLRRPELERPGILVYERPDGQLQAFDVKQKLTIHRYVAPPEW